MNMKGIVLVADDDTDILNAYNHILNNAGYRVFLSKTGDQCIHLAAEIKPDIVLLDIVLPDISGMDVLKILKNGEDTKHCFVVLISSKLTTPDDQSSGLESGADGFMLKPLASRELTARVDAYMRHKSTIDKLRESERQKINLIGNLPGAVYKCSNDQHWTMHYLSSGCLELTGYHPAELESNQLISYGNLIHDEDRDKVWQVIQDMVRNNERFQISYRIKTRTGKEKWVYEQGSPVFSEGKLTGIEGFITDISRQKQQEIKLEFLFRLASAAIHTSDIEELVGTIKHRLSVILNTENLSISLIDATYPGPADNKGHKQEQENLKAQNSLSEWLINQKQSMLLKKNDISRMIKQGKISKDVNTCECWLGVPLFCGYEVAGLIVAYDNEDPEAFNQESLKIMEFASSHISIAMHRRKSFEDLLSAKEKAEESDRLKTAFLNNLSHEVRTPLNAIMGFSDLLGNDKGNELIRKQYSDLIIRSGEQLLSIIDDIINISTIEAGLEKASFRATDINSILENLYHQTVPLLSGKPVDFKFRNKLGKSSGIVLTDKQKLQHIISNLLQNAVRFTSTGHIELGAHKRNNRITIYVRDTGRGIPSNEQELIFERFRQGDSSGRDVVTGLGLGLSISKAFAGLIKGRLWVESEPGKGSTFYLSIPLSPGN